MARIVAIACAAPVAAAASALGDVVRNADRFARQQEGAHARFQFLVGQRRARALVQVVGP